MVTGDQKLDGKYSICPRLSGFRYLDTNGARESFTAFTTRDLVLTSCNESGRVLGLEDPSNNSLAH